MAATGLETSLHKGPRESEELLPNQTSKSNKQWSTTQLILICVIIAIIAVLATNLDRIIDALKDDSSSSNDLPSSFGHEMYDYFEFTLDGNRDLNWGSWGGYPISIKEQMNDLHGHILSDMMAYQIFERPSSQRETLSILAAYLGIENSDDMVFVDNASHGVNAIIRSLSQFLYENNCYEIYNDSTLHNKTCKILQFNTAYPMITESLWYINNNLGSPTDQILMFNLTDNMLNDTDLLIAELNQFILNEYEMTNNNTFIYMAIISEITAYPATVLNIREIIEQVLRPNKILSIIDAAHSLGSIPIDISDMDPDVYIATGYKWFYAPRGSGIMYVKNQLNMQQLIYPTVISIGTRGADFQSKFGFSGAKDYTPWIGMKYALEWRQNLSIVDDTGDAVTVGDDGILEYIHDLAVAGGELVAKIWNTSLLFDDEEYIGSMVNVVFITQDPVEVNAIQGIMFTRQQIWWNRPGVSLDGQEIVRLCAQIFLELSDFEEFAYVVKDILEQIRSQ